MIETDGNAINHKGIMGKPKIWRVYERKQKKNRLTDEVAKKTKLTEELVK
jgi:hypothetical protein